MNRISFAILTNELFENWINNNKTLTDTSISLKNVDYDNLIALIYDEKNIYSFFTYLNYNNFSINIKQFLEDLRIFDNKKYSYVSLYLESIESILKLIIDTEILIHLYNYLIMFSTSSLPQGNTYLYNDNFQTNEISFYNDLKTIYEQSTMFLSQTIEDIDISKERYEKRVTINNLIKKLLKKYYTNALFCEFKKSFLEYLNKSNLPTEIILRYKEFLEYFHATLRNTFNQDKKSITLDIFKRNI